MSFLPKDFTGPWALISKDDIPIQLAVSCFMAGTLLDDTKDYFSNFEEARYILNQNSINVNKHDTPYCNTLLLWSIYNSSIASAIFMIMNYDSFAYTVNLTCIDCKNFTPLMVAIKKGFLRCNDDIVDKPCLRMGTFIYAYLKMCSDIDLIHLNNTCETAFDIALSLYDAETILLFLHTHRNWTINYLKNKYKTNNFIQKNYIDANSDTVIQNYDSYIAHCEQDKASISGVYSDCIQPSIYIKSRAGTPSKIKTLNGLVIPQSEIVSILIDNQTFLTNLFRLVLSDQNFDHVFTDRIPNFEDFINDMNMDIFAISGIDLSNLSGGDKSYFHKYLKYKTKYLSTQ